MTTAAQSMMTKINQQAESWERVTVSASECRAIEGETLADQYDACRRLFPDGSAIRLDWPGAWSDEGRYTAIGEW